MSGSSRRTGKLAAARQISRLLGIAEPQSPGGTIPASWLREVIIELDGEGAVDGVAAKRDLLRLAVNLCGGVWSDDMIVWPGSTITGEALWQLHDLVAVRLAGGSRTGRAAAPTSDSLMVPIRPKVGMYSAFARLNYKPWYAIAEFVDNALQSFLARRAVLAANGTTTLRIEVRIEPDLIRVSDNAAGIAVGDMDRAFSPALPPPDRSGLSEFGIGMKAAACWFANHWRVRTSALGEGLEREVAFDVPKIVATGTEHLAVSMSRARPEDHYTVIELTDLRVQPKGRTITKIREHLASIYRQFTRRGDLELHFVTPSISEDLQHEEPTILEAPYFRTPDAEPIRWWKEIDLDVGAGQRVWGWAGLLATASTTRAGFAVLRRERLIEGSADETWRPERIFRTPNTYTYQRLVGEFQVEGFNVSHTKDGIQWGDVEDEVLDLLYELIDSDDMPLIRQAEGHRVRKKAKEISRNFGQEAVDATGEAITAKAAPVLQGQIAAPAEELDDIAPLPVPQAVTAQRVVVVKPRDDTRVWQISIQVVRERSEDWYSCRSPVLLGQSKDGTDEWGMDIRLNLDHPFSELFINESESVLAPVLRIVAALALAEATAREAGTKHAGRIRRNVNDLLRYALAGEGQDDHD